MNPHKQALERNSSFARKYNEVINALRRDTYELFCGAIDREENNLAEDLMSYLLRLTAQISEVPAPSDVLVYPLGYVTEDDIRFGKKSFAWRILIECACTWEWDESVTQMRQMYQPLDCIDYIVFKWHRHYRECDLAQFMCDEHCQGEWDIVTGVRVV